MMNTTEVWLAYFEKCAALKRIEDTKVETKIHYLLYMYSKGLESRTIIKASPDKIQELKSSRDDVIGVKRMSDAEIKLAKALEMPTYEI